MTGEGLPEDFSIDKEFDEEDEEGLQGLENVSDAVLMEQAESQWFVFSCLLFVFLTFVIRTCCTRKWKRKQKTLVAAIVLFSIGLLLIIIGGALVAKGEQSSVGIAVLVIGCLLFIPGSYSTFLFYKAYTKAPGYDIDSIPDF